MSSNKRKDQATDHATNPATKALSMTLSGIVLTAVIATMTACTSKKREDVLAQGDSLEGLYATQDYFNKDFPIQTLEAKNSSALNLSTIEDKTSSRSDKAAGQNKPLFSIVDYKSDTTLIAQFNQDKFPLVAMEKQTDQYWYHFKINNSYLTVYKKARKEFIPLNEQDYAITEDGFLLVPQFTFKIQLFRYERIRNEDNENTHVLKLFPTDKLSEANYFKPDLDSAQYMERAPRKFVFPKSYFKGPWYYASTVIGVSQNNPQIPFQPGTDLSLDFKLNPASRIEFTVDQYRLSAKNTNLDAILKNDELNSDDVLNIGISAMDFRLKPASGNSPKMTEEVLNDQHPHSRPWQEREYIQLDFTKVSVVAAWIAEEKGEFGDSLLVDFTSDETYFGFTVFYATRKMKVRYSFRRAPETAAPKRLAYSTDMMKHFGFFTTAEHFVAGPQHVRPNDYEQNTFINRFVPTPDKNGLKKIVYHLSTGSPELDSPFVQVVRDSLKEWNDLFQKVDPNYSVTLDETTKVDLGDIRYNIVNIIDNSVSGGLLGYGPSVADTKSGEIISATANIYIQPLREIYIDSLRNHLYTEIGLVSQEKFYDPTPVLNSMVETLSKQNISLPYLSEAIALQKSNFGNIAGNPTLTLATAAAGDTKGLLSFGSQSKGANLGTARQKAGASAASLKLAKKVSSCKNISISQREVVEMAAEHCPGFLNYMKELREKNEERKSKKLDLITHTEKEFEVLKSCANEILKPQLKETLMHELGHNFGLRHNFLASTDLRNFSDDINSANVAQVKTMRPASSVMDYLPITAPAHKTLGPYDEAAIRFGYTGKVEQVEGGRNTGKYVAIDTSRPLDSQTNLNYRNFRFCTDEDIDPNAFTREPMCAVWDFGTNPLEIINNYIIEMNSFFATGRYRFDMQTVPIAFDGNNEEEILSRIFLGRFVFPMLRVYSEWRVRLATLLRDPNLKHLEGLSDEQLMAKISEKSATLFSGANGESMKRDFYSFFAAGQLINDMLVNISSKPARQCIGFKADGEMVVRSFQSLTKELLTNQLYAKDCNDPEIGKLMGVAEAIGYGEIYKNHQFRPELQDRRAYWSPDVVGIEDVVMSAANAFSGNTNFVPSTSQRSDALQLNPTPIQEPFWRKKFEEMFITRFTKGVPFSALDPVQFKDSDEVLYSFQEYSEVIPALRNALSNYVKNIKNTAIKRQEGSKFVTMTTSNGTQDLLEIPDGALAWSYPEFGKQQFFYAPAGATISAELINKYHTNSALEVIAAQLEKINSDPTDDAAQISKEWADAIAKLEASGNAQFADWTFVDKTFDDALAALQALADAKVLDITGAGYESGTATSALQVFELAGRDLLKNPKFFAEVSYTSEKVPLAGNKESLAGLGDLGTINIADVLKNEKGEPGLPEHLKKPIREWDKYVITLYQNYLKNREETRGQTEAIRNSFNSNFGQ